ncbi:MAG: hypothetical protein MJZ21_04870, partial [archaeon]|nr:hypothetical protein [archaeon]
VHNSVIDLASSKQLLLSNEISTFNRHINILKGCTPQTFILYLKNIIKINNYIKEQFPDADDEMMDNSFSNLINEIKSCNSLQDLCKYLKNSIINNVKADTHNVSVMTFHASKGLEFDKVIIPDVVEGIIPGRISIGNIRII